MQTDAYCGNDSVELENLVRLWYHRATRDDKQDQYAASKHLNGLLGGCIDLD